jgi:CRISPR-associated protein Cas2
MRQQGRLRKLINLDEESIRFYPLSSHTLSQVKTWGVGASIADTKLHSDVESS